uniref:NR LBD domain-containing protein n=1 Tax=Caenorhabditis tropicalis TaxID=1561998 RepID=A0A1I7SYD4_9PELO
MTSPQAFQKTLMSSFKAYLPEEHWDLVKWNAAGLLIVPSVLKISMYGTEEELAANVQLFRRFPGSHMYFDSEPTELTTYNAMYCKSLKTKEYVFKLDIYNVLSTVVFSSTVDPDVVPLISFYLRTKEKQLNGKFEMVQHLNEELNKFDDMLITALENSEDSNKKPRLKRGTLSEIFASVKQLLPKNDDDPEYKSIHNLLESCIAWRMDPYFSEGSPIFLMKFEGTPILFM